MYGVNQFHRLRDGAICAQELAMGKLSLVDMVAMVQGGRRQEHIQLRKTIIKSVSSSMVIGLILGIQERN